MGWWVGFDEGSVDGCNEGIDACDERYDEGFGTESIKITNDPWVCLLFLFKYFYMRCTMEIAVIQKDKQH